MKSVYSSDNYQADPDFNEIYTDSLMSTGDLLYNLYVELHHRGVPQMHAYSKISNSANANSLASYHVKNMACGKIPGLMHNTPKLEYISNSILNGDVTDVHSKTIKFQVLYSEDIGYAKIYGFVPKNNIHVLSIQINGITVHYTNIINHSEESIFEEYLNNCNMYIEDEYAIEKYNTIYIITKSHMLIEKLGIDKNTKFIPVEIQYYVTGKSTLSKIKKFKSTVMSHEMLMNGDYSCRAYETIPDYCFASDMDNTMLSATNFKPERDCHIYKLIQDSKKKGVQIKRDCTKNCVYMNLTSKKDV